MGYLCTISFNTYNYYFADGKIRSPEKLGGKLPKVLQLRDYPTATVWTQTI